jgi:hypothetical protein
MGGQSAPAPQQAYTPAPAPTAAETTREYYESMPLQYQMQQEYGQKFNQLDYEALQKYTPLVNDLMQAEQQRLSPNQYALNEDLAAQALAGSKADLPSLMKQSALDTFRSEIGSNVGSPIGAEYTSRNLAQLGEQYRNNYQNMGLSLLNKFPTTTQSPNLASPAKSDYSLGASSSNQMQGYGMYQTALANSYYQPAPKSNPWGNMVGSLASGFGQGAGSAIGAGMFACWIAKAIFGSWEHPKTSAFRMFLINISPKWFSDWYVANGQKVGAYIEDKPIIKLLLRPLFEVGAFLGERECVRLGVC